MSLQIELLSIAGAVEKIGCRIGEDPEHFALRKEALADRIRLVSAKIGGDA